MKYILLILAQLSFIQVSISQVDSTLQIKKNTSVDSTIENITPKKNHPFQAICATAKRIEPLPIPTRVAPIRKVITLQHFKNINKRQFESTEISILATRDIEEISATSAGFVQTYNGYCFKGGGENGNAYFLDGIRLIPEVILLQPDTGLL